MCVLCISPCDTAYMISNQYLECVSGIGCRPQHKHCIQFPRIVPSSTAHAAFAHRAKQVRVKYVIASSLSMIFKDRVCM